MQDLTPTVTGHDRFPESGGHAAAPSWRLAPIAALAPMLVTGSLALAQEYPARAVRMVVPFPVGAGTDLLARGIGQRLAEQWGQPVVADAESGYAGFEVNAWQGTVGPAGLPASIVARLNEGIQRALAAPELRDRMAAIGLVVGGSTPAEFGAYLRSEQAKWADVVRRAGIRGD